MALKLWNIFAVSPMYTVMHDALFPLSRWHGGRWNVEGAGALCLLQLQASLWFDHFFFFFFFLLLPCSWTALLVETRRPISLFRLPSRHVSRRERGRTVLTVTPFRNSRNKKKVILKKKKKKRECKILLFLCERLNKTYMTQRFQLWGSSREEVYLWPHAVSVPPFDSWPHTVTSLEQLPCLINHLCVNRHTHTPQFLQRFHPCAMFYSPSLLDCLQRPLTSSTRPKR